MPASTSPPEGRKLKILMLHGYTQSGATFEIKTKALKKSLQKHFPPAPAAGHLKAYPGGLELIYPTAPLKLVPNDIPGYDVDGAAAKHGEADQIEAYGWWRRRGDAEPFTYEGMEIGLAHLAQVISDSGPFDGALGFSQGGALAGMLASLLEPGRRGAFEAAQRDRGGMGYPEAFVKDSGFLEDVVQEPLKFAVSYSGFGASTNALYQAYYEPGIRTPMMHFLGSVDTVVSEERSLRLVEACVGGRGKEGGVQRVVYHPGGHFLPSSGKVYVAALVGFVREVLGEEGSGQKGKEAGVEDMEMPF
ncbi:hypothetical protein B0A50_06526 [Salinomyces thailandicus]|uniref:Serine hydrolase domain-containing protein n=1 Tax=Salinomyces thailandicus TaxID=706561 RepID=A0A4U0TNW2_9PEZI|nr:hypothetical protein B0A50_06526 [Salinomyces thailandica]